MWKPIGDWFRIWDLNWIKLYWFLKKIINWWLLLKLIIIVIILIYVTYIVI
jgi:hypothetical protein